tara:strand:- start:31 stop:873 length:843 start_codon:yes stop_codon:yes gene_type:complete
MRYRIHSSIRQLLKRHSKTLLATSIGPNLKNLIYKNKSISEHQLETLLSAINVSKQTLSLQEKHFHPEVNFGKSYAPAKLVFKGRGKEFAEFIGIMLGDGNIYRNSVRITLSSEEVTYRKYVVCLFEKLFDLQLKEYRYKKCKTVQLYAYNKSLRVLLEKHGLGQGNKVKRNIRVPSWIRNSKVFSKHCIRGMIDTDGNVHYHKRDKQMYVSFKNHAPNLLKDLQKMAKYYNLHFVRNNLYAISLYRKCDVRNYIKEVGFSNEKHLKKVRTFLGLCSSLV